MGKLNVVCVSHVSQGKESILDVFVTDFSGGPVVKTALLLQGAQVPSLVGELRSRMLCGMAKKKKKVCLKNLASIEVEIFHN